MPLIPCWLIQLQSSMKQFSFRLYDAAASGFNSLIPAPNVSSLMSTEPVEWLRRASDISSTNPFCFINKKQEAVEAFLLCFIYKYAQLLPACTERKFSAIKVTTQAGGQTLRPKQKSEAQSDRNENLLLVSLR